MATIKLNILKPQLDLYKHIALLGPDEAIILCQGDRPIAEIRLLPGTPGKQRPMGLKAGIAEVPESFFDPLPDDLLDLFEGKLRTR